MYIVKTWIIKSRDDKKLLNVRCFNKCSHAIDAIISGNIEIYDNIPDEMYNEIQFDKPEMIVSCGVDKSGFATDFEFRYPNGITVYMGEPIIEDEERN